MWNKFIIAKKRQANCVPIHVLGINSGRSQLLSHGMSRHKSMVKNVKVTESEMVSLKLFSDD